MHLPKICSLRSQIFCFLHASSKNLFASLTDFLFCTCTSLSLSSLTSFARGSLRSLFCACVFARCARERCAKSARFAHRFSVCDMHLPKICSLRSQIFFFVHAPHCLCLRSLRSREVRFAHFSVPVFSLAALARGAQNLLASLTDFPFAMCIFLNVFSLSALARGSIGSRFFRFFERIFIRRRD